MIVIMNEDAERNKELFADFAKYDTVDNYIAEVIAGKDLFQPLSLTVCFNKVSHTDTVFCKHRVKYSICDMGVVALDAECFLDDIRSLPKSRLEISNVDIVVNGRRRYVHISIP